ncbi:MFS transporter [Rossellomorea vietnamensis]|uniref:MFS transporter n=1 Tax=Rossellomorea vietnamensis TaxID=218284 RepID=A0A0P6VZ29_9BACI|nr:MFS transporter [Rossellomorea vietnamensis]KPL58265.1 MFS transporter [Rossellomorea vietnamensis]
MERNVRNQIFTLQGFYLLTFFGVGSLYPLLSVYLSESVGLNGYQIGTIMSVGPIMMIFFQPIWGMVSDTTNKPTVVLGLTSLVAGIFALGYLFMDVYYGLLVVAILVAIFQSAIIPVSDSISLKYISKVRYNYGNIRLFGSLGFGIAVFIMGRLSEGFIGPTIIFYSFFICLVLSGFLSFRFPKERAAAKLDLKAGMKELFTMKKFLIFLAVTFLVFGPNLANNVYFGLFVEDSGGTYAGIGLAFLIAVLSEVPFMRIAGGWIDKFGLLTVAALAGAASMIRWLFYFTEPSLWLVYSSAVMQGLAIGLFIPAGLRYIKEITPAHITATAVTVYSAIGNGLGNWFSTFVGGFIYETYSIYTVYLFFAVLSLLGIFLCFVLMKEEKKNALAY